MIAQVVYMTYVYATVDTDTGEVTNVNVMDECLSLHDVIDVDRDEALTSGEDFDRILEIADSSDWPIWTMGW